MCADPAVLVNLSSVALLVSPPDAGASLALELDIDMQLTWIFSRPLSCADLRPGLYARMHINIRISFLRRWRSLPVE